MKEIFLLAVVAGILFLFFWIVIVVLEKMFKVGGKGINRGGKREVAGTTGKKIAPIVVAGITAYEEEEERGIVRGEAQKKKDETISLWRFTERVG